MTMTIATLFLLALFVAGAVGLFAGLSIASYIYKTGVTTPPGSDSITTNSDKTRLFFYRNGITYEYTLSTPGDMTTAVFDKSY